MSSAELARIHQTIADLCGRWPKCFSVLEARRRPLKVGIDQDIAAAIPDLDPTALSASLRYYCRSIGYLDACRLGMPRIDLQGEPCGSISEGDAGHAASHYAKALQRRAAKRKASTATIPAPVTSPSPSSSPARLGLADLKAAALARKQQGQAS
jgi:ProP effector